MMVEPLCLAMTSTHVVAASTDTVFVWLYNPVTGAHCLSGCITLYVNCLSGIGKKNSYRCILFVWLRNPFDRCMLFVWLLTL